MDEKTVGAEDGIHKAETNPEVTERDAARLDIDVLLDLVDERVQAMKSYLSDTSKKMDDEISGIKKKVQGNLARDFSEVMKTLDDEISEAAKLDDEGTASLKSMAQGIALINEFAKKAVVDIDFSSASTTKSNDAPAAVKRKGPRKKGMGGLLKAASKAADNPFASVETILSRLQAAEEKLDLFTDEEKTELSEKLSLARGTLENVSEERVKLNSRIESEKEKARKFGCEKLVVKFAEVVDNMDRAISVVDKTASGVTEDEHLKRLYNGVKETRSLLIEAFETHGIKRSDPTGQPFDPNLHMAVSTRSCAADEKENTVAEVMAPGYTLNGRVVRSAMVIVAQ